MKSLFFESFSTWYSSIGASTFGKGGQLNCNLLMISMHRTKIKLVAVFELKIPLSILQRNTQDDFTYLSPWGIHCFLVVLIRGSKIWKAEEIITVLKDWAWLWLSEKIKKLFALSECPYRLFFSPPSLPSQYFSLNRTRSLSLTALLASGFSHIKKNFDSNSAKTFDECFC